MQGSQIFLGNFLNPPKQFENFMGTFPAESRKFEFSSPSSRSLSARPNAYTKALSCIARIEDPLWKKVCEEVLNMMGAISVLKIWDSMLGESLLPNKEFEIICETVESAVFVQQYAFVIVSILQRYFPSLKKLNVQTK